MNIYLKHPQTGAIKECPTGFSWTMLFFGFFVPLFRKNWKWAAIMFFGALVAFEIMGDAACLISIACAFIFNKEHIKDLISEGYKPNDESSAEWLKNNGIFISE